MLPKALPLIASHPPRVLIATGSMPCMRGAAYSNCTTFDCCHPTVTVAFVPRPWPAGARHSRRLRATEVRFTTHSREHQHVVARWLGGRRSHSFGHTAWSRNAQFESKRTDSVSAVSKLSPLR